MKIKIDIEDVKTIAEVMKLIQTIREDGGSMQPFEFEISKELIKIIATQIRIPDNGEIFGVPFTVVERIDKQRVEEVIYEFIERVNRKVIHYPDMQECPYCKENFNKANNRDKLFSMTVLNELLKKLELTDGKTD